MGRIQFSQSYVPPTIRTEPEIQVDDDDVVDRYSHINRFDPDSEDFFRDAEYEAFIDPISIQNSGASTPLTNDTVIYSDSSDSSSSSDNGVDSPMPLALDIATPLTDAPVTDISAQWQQLQRELDAVNREWRSRRAEVEDIQPSGSSVLFRTSLPPSPSTIGNIRISIPSYRHTSSATRRVVNITPVRVSSRTPSTRSPSPVTPSPPSTPPPQSSARLLSTPLTLLTPSPPPTVSPRYYSWQARTVPAMQPSPTILRNNNARRSLANIDTAPLRIEAPVM